MCANIGTPCDWLLRGFVSSDLSKPSNSRRQGGCFSWLGQGSNTSSSVHGDIWNSRWPQSRVGDVFEISLPLGGLRLGNHIRFHFYHVWAITLQCTAPFVNQVAPIFCPYLLDVVREFLSRIPMGVPKSSMWSWSSIISFSYSCVIYV